MKDKRNIIASIIAAIVFITGFIYCKKKEKELKKENKKLKIILDKTFNKSSEFVKDMGVYLDYYDKALETRDEKIKKYEEKLKKYEEN